jgi:hypothetical protein
LLKGEGIGFGRDLEQWGFCLVHDNLVLLANCTSLDIVCYLLCHSWPLGDLLSLTEGFIASWVACRWVVVCKYHKGLPFIVIDWGFDSDSIDKLM